MGRTKRKRQRQKHTAEQIKATLDQNSLIKWSLENGLVLNGVTPKIFHDSGRGLKTTRNIYPPKVIISVPKNIMITMDTVWNCELIRTMMSHKGSIMGPKDAFILFLLLERNKGVNSWYHKYIRSLPTSFTTPSYITRKELYVLPTFIQEEVHRQSKLICDIFSRITRTCKLCHLADFKLLIGSRGDVRWAWNVINTRSVYFDRNYLKCKDLIDTAEVNFALLPVLDMLNHKDTADISVRFSEHECLSIETNDHYSSEDQIYINYGPHSNRTLLFEYGFILPKNLHSMLPVPKELMTRYLMENDNEEIKCVKIKSLQKIGIKIDNACVSIDGFDWSFVTAAHVFSDSLLSKKLLSETSIDVAPCISNCIITTPSKHILNDLIISHKHYLCSMEEYSSQTLFFVKNLIVSEIEMMQSVLDGLSDKCLLI